MLLYAFTTVQHNTSTRYAREGGSTNRPYPPLTHNDEEGWKREKKVKHRTEQSPMHLCHCDESGVVERKERRKTFVLQNNIINIIESNSRPRRGRQIIIPNRKGRNCKGENQKEA